MKHQHTPGPWVYDETWSLIHGGPDSVEVAAIHAAVKDGQRIDRAQPVIARANAHLIEAAPDLLVALETLENLGSNGAWPGSEDLMAARAAIAKARGEVQS